MENKNTDDFYDFETDYDYGKTCKITCGHEIRYCETTDYAKQIGTEMAKNRVEIPTRDTNPNAGDIVVTYLDRVIAIRRYVPADYNKDDYKAFLKVVDPYRPSEEIPNPIILKSGYYTDWIQMI